MITPPAAASVSALLLRVEPLRNPQPPGGSTFFVHWLESGDRLLWHAHPDRTVLDAVAGDVLVHCQGKQRYRLVSAQVYRAAGIPCRGREYPSADSVPGAIEAAPADGN